MKRDLRSSLASYGPPDAGTGRETSMKAFRVSPCPRSLEIKRSSQEELISVLDVFWIFFMLSALQPVIRQRMLDAMRMCKIAQLERARSSRVILLVHRQETMKLLGFPVMRYIDVNDSEEVMRAIHMTAADVPLDIIVPTQQVSRSPQAERAVQPDH
jgi:hypothetical protein